MAERLLVPINQQKQIKEGWCTGFSQRDVVLRYDNPDYRYYINPKFLRGLPRLGGRVLAFTAEFAANEIPNEYRREGVFDLSLGAELVRLTTGERIRNAVSFDERDTLHATASNLKYKTWVFDAEQVEEYVPPAPVEARPSFKLREIFRSRG